MPKRIALAVVIVLAVLTGTVCADESSQAALDLKSAVALALETSPRISAAGASADMTRAQVDKARSALGPNLGFESGYSYLSKETVFGATPIWERNTVSNRVSLQQMLYSGGQAQANVARARAGYAAAGQGAKAARADVATTVGVAYFRARQAAEAVSVAEASVKSLEESYSVARKMRESGLVTKSDVLRAEVALTSARESVIRSRNDYNVAIAALRSAIGLPQDQNIELAANSSDAAADTADKAAPAERPEIAAAAASVRAAEAGTKAARAGNMPTVALAADYYNEPAGSEFPRMSNTVLAGVVVKLNAFDGGLTRADIAEANAALQKARKDLESEKRMVELEQESARMDLDSSKARVQTTASQVQSAEESFRVLQAGYREGITPLTDVLAAEAALTGARVSRLAALYDVKIAQLSLLRAYGQTDVLWR